MSDLNDIKKSVDDLKLIVVTHITETNTYRAQRDKVVDAHSESLWDKEHGLEKKVDRLEQIETARKWTIRAIATATIAGITDKFLHVLPK